jgi:hypothetical protein
MGLERIFILIIKVISQGQSRDSSVGIALGYGLDDWGSIPGGGWEFFS